MSGDLHHHDSTTPSPVGRGRRVLLLVTGGIAAYKACTVVRRLADAGCAVQVAMTDAATRFVGPLTFEALSGRPVGTTLWGEGGESPLDHIQWAQHTDLVLVAPATANFLAKMAHGLADDLPSTLVTATTAPIVVAPAMNDRMWSNPANRENLRTLRDRGIEIIDPGSGYLACGTVAEGRLAEPEAIVEFVRERLERGPWSGKRVLVTGGGTRERLDAVRWIGNESSGRTGIALAEVARDLGARVTLLLGPTDLPLPAGIDVQRFRTTSDLQSLLEQHSTAADCILMSAAVSDFRPINADDAKLKKQSGVPRVELEATPDLLEGLGTSRREGQVLVGFALETGTDEDVAAQAQAKLGRKKLDLICGNHADRPGEGFGGDANRIFLYDRTGRSEWTSSSSKRDLARLILLRAAELAAAPPAAGAEG